MKTSFQREKIAHFIAYFTENLRFCGITKLYKVMSFADFAHIKETGKSITGLDYITYPKGPYPIALNNEIKDQSSFFGQIISFKGRIDSELELIHSKIKFDEKYFSQRELKIMGNMVFVFKDVTAKDMVLASHEADKPWKMTKEEKGMYKRIDPELALDGSKGSVTIKEYRQLEKESEEFQRMIYG